MLSYKQKAYEIIKEKIITCELAPSSVIDLNSLMEEIGTSRTPIRDAISALEQENLVVVLPRRGVLVSPIPLDEVYHIYMIRHVVEPMVAHLVTPIVNEAELRHFAAIFSDPQTDNMTIFKADRDFHQYLINMSGNPYLIRMMDAVLANNLRIVVLGASLPQRLSHSNKEHLDIIDALLSRDQAAAKKTMAFHIGKAKESAINITQAPVWEEDDESNIGS